MRRAGPCVVVLVLLVGCAGEYLPQEPPAVNPAAAAQAADVAANAGAAAGAVPEAQAPQETLRRILYEAKLDLVVKDVAETDRTLRGFVEGAGGYLAEAVLDRSQGASSTSRWVARVPSERFRGFVESVAALGVAVQQSQNAQDVTEEFVDLQARIENKRRLEGRIAELLAQRTGRIEEVVAVENELGRVREEIERMQGRLHYLRNRTAFATVTITAREVQEYVPPQAPTFGDRVAGTWRNSLSALRSTGESLTIAVVATAPWLVAAVVIALPSWFATRPVRRRFAGAAQGSPGKGGAGPASTQR